uniref:Uncharacterized protein n=1 Tax=Arundo donax TaxID=35708 RepID=A0A0A9HRW1_ARUDO
MEMMVATAVGVLRMLGPGGEAVGVGGDGERGRWRCAVMRVGA